MKRFVLIMIATLSISIMAVADVRVQGNWEGSFDGKAFKDSALRMEVVGQPQETYRVNVFIKDRKRGELRGMSSHGTGVLVGRIDAKGDLGLGMMTATITGRTMAGTFVQDKKSGGKTVVFAAEKVFKRPPTLGQDPPSGAVVLLREGGDLSAWNRVPGNLQNGAMKIGASNFVSKQSFGSAHYHIEFKNPYMPNESGQGRGNSGVYVQGRYEIQVLDSFGDLPQNNTCGAIYSIATPPLTASLPPEEWQTYDITFTAAQFDANGKKVKDAVVTVLQNGITLYQDLVLPHSTPGGISKEEVAEGPLWLQNHNNPVMYRNVWVKPLND